MLRFFVEVMVYGAKDGGCSTGRWRTGNEITVLWISLAVARKSWSANSFWKQTWGWLLHNEIDSEVRVDCQSHSLSFLTDHIVLTLKLGLTWKNGKSLHRVVRSARRPKRTPVQPVRMDSCRRGVEHRNNAAKGTVINLWIHHWIDHEDCRCFPFLARPCRSHRAHPRQLGLRNCRKDDFRQVPRSLYVSLNLWGFWVPQLWFWR